MYDAPNAAEELKCPRSHPTAEMVEAIKAYFKGVKTEWGKISWPEKNQVIIETLSVIVIVVVFTVAIYLMDLLFKGSLGLIVKFFQHL